MNKKKKIILTISILLLVVILGVGGLVGNYFYNLALNPFTSKDMIFGDDYDDSSLEVEADVNWLIKDSNYIDTYITSSDNLKLHAYEVKNENKMRGNHREGLSCNSPSLWLIVKQKREIEERIHCQLR